MIGVSSAGRLTTGQQVDFCLGRTNLEKSIDFLKVSLGNCLSKRGTDLIMKKFLGSSEGISLRANLLNRNEII